jgi:hypothetical protein
VFAKLELIHQMIEGAPRRPNNSPNATQPSSSIHIDPGCFSANAESYTCKIGKTQQPEKWK